LPVAPSSAAPPPCDALSLMATFSRTPSHLRRLSRERPLTYRSSPGDALSPPAATPSTRKSNFDAHLPIRTPNSSRARAPARHGGRCASSAPRRLATQPAPVVGLGGMASAAVVRSTLLLTPHPRRAPPLSTRICQFACQIPVAPRHLRVGNAGARRQRRPGLPADESGLNGRRSTEPPAFSAPALPRPRR
jgi:hypothetical protein